VTGVQTCALPIYGISEILFAKIKEHKLTHIVFETENDGYIKLPINIVEDYLKIANCAKKSYGSPYHIYIKRDDEGLKLFKSNEFDVLLNDFMIDEL
jgi:hypothetical protein